MESLHDLLLRRHSIRRYTDQAIDPETVMKILQAGLLAPSSKSSRPWHFVVVDDKAVLERLAGCKEAGARPILAASMAIVVCADPESTDMFIEDMSIAATLMHVQAAALGIGSCWIQVRNRYDADGEPAENNVREILGIPDNMIVECILSMGYPNEERKPVDPEKLLWEKVHTENWNNGE